MRILRYFVLLLFAWSVAGHATDHEHMDERMVELDDGSRIKVFVFHPDTGGEGPFPLSVLMPGGTANEYVARAQFWLGHELTNRGWAVAVPVSPDASSFFGENARKIPEVISRLQTSARIEEGKSLLVGVSNGGSSAIEIAAHNPANYLGVVAVPGIIKNPEVIDDMKGLPMYIRIGENDLLRWYRHLPDVTRTLREAGATVNADLVPDANHVFPLNWQELQPWLDSITCGS